MWPLILDLSKDECKKMLRRLELEAYTSIVTAFRAQGELTKEKKKVLQDLCNLLGISTERHRAEIRRAVNDEKLNTIADQIAGSSMSAEWAIEGRRLVPLMPRLVPQTALTAIANNTANMSAAQNACLPPPSSTSNKQAENIPVSHEVEITASAKASGNRGGQSAKMKQSPNSSHTTQIYSSSQIQVQPEIDLFSGSQSGYVEEVENQHESQLSNTTSGNIVMLPGGMSIHVKAGNVDVASEEEKGRHRKRSSSADTPVTSQKIATLTTSSASQRTVSIPIGGTPVQFTLTGTGQKSGSSGTLTNSGQKVILVSTSCSNLPSSILQRTLGGQIRSVFTTANLSQTQTKSTSLISPISAGGNAATPSSAVRQKGKSGLMVPACTQSSTASAQTQTFQIRPGSTGAKPTAFQFKDGTGLKIIAQALPMSSGGAKMLANPTGSGNASPIVVVTKTASLAPGSQPGTRVVNVITTQAASGKVIMPSSFTVAKSAGSSTLVTVGSKGKQAALVKVSPTMSLSAQGGKPNLFVVQKAHVTHSASGNVFPLSALTSAGTQTMLKANSESGQLEKASHIEMKSSVLADLLQAAGILPEGASADIQAGNFSYLEDRSKAETKGSDVAENSLSGGDWMDVDDGFKTEDLREDKEHALSMISSEQERPKMNSIQQLDLPFEVEDDQADSTEIIRSHKLTEEALNLLKQAGLGIAAEIADNRHGNTEEVDSANSSGEVSQDVQVVHIPETAPASSEQPTSPVSYCLQSSIGQATPCENGELDPTTGIFYPYPRNDKNENVTLELACSNKGELQCQIEQITSKSILEKQGSEQLDSGISLEGGAAELNAKEKQNVADAIKSDILSSDSSEALSVEQNSSVAIKSGTESKDVIQRKRGTKIPISACITPQSLYRGVTYSKEDAAARKKISQKDEIKVADSVENLENSSSNQQVCESMCKNVDITDMTNEPEAVVVEEIVECEEVQFTEENIITTGIEETVITMDDNEHCVIVENDQTCFVTENIQTVEEATPSTETQLLVNETDLAVEPSSSVVIKQEKDSGDSVDLGLVAFSTMPVSIKDVLASSESQSSGSSIFMVTDSVLGSDPVNIPLVAPYSDEIVTVEPLELSSESGKIPVAEVTVHEDGTTSYVVRQQDEQDAVDEDDKKAVEYQSKDEGFASPSAIAVTGKRKRKPNTLRTSDIEENPTTPHLTGWARSAMGLLLRVMKFRGTKRVKGGLGAAHWFLHPVTEEEAPGYNEVVKYPMDFSTVKKKLETGCYKDISEFNQDMNLVKINCDIYNPPEHEARLDCEEVFAFYNQEYERLTDKWQKTHLISSHHKKLKHS